MEDKELTGYPSIDRPWLKYYAREVINAKVPDCSIYEYLVECNANGLQDTAIEYLGRKVSYQDLFRSIDRVADALVAAGVRTGDCVAVSLANSPENAYILYALSKIGAGANFIDPRTKADDLAYFLEEGDCDVLFACSLFIDEAVAAVERANIKLLVSVSPLESAPLPVKVIGSLRLGGKGVQLMSGRVAKWDAFLKGGRGVDADVVSSSSEYVTCVFHTSGTTGRPKGVLTTNAVFNAMKLELELCGGEWNLGNRYLNQVPPYLAYNALCSLHFPLCMHMDLVMLPKYEPSKFGENLISFRPNHMMAGPADWCNLLKSEAIAKKGSLAFLVTMVSGSDKLSETKKSEINELLKKKGCHRSILEGYGMTEVESAACSAVPQHVKAGSVGIPLPLTRFRIDRDGEEAACGEVGEILMSGPTLMQGYLANPAATDEALWTSPDGVTWMRSGDLGRMDEDGNVYIEGRMKRIIVRHDGIKVSPFESERALLEMENVLECCTVGAPDIEHGMGEVPVSFVVMESVVTPESMEALREALKETLNEKEIPVSIFLVDALPLTLNAKVDYQELERRAAEILA